jgi:HD-GYP domain-containing protein (c-di-GMP phosphodiesterase class II)
MLAARGVVPRPLFGPLAKLTKRSRAAALWKKAEGDMSQKFGYDHNREEAEKRCSDSAEWQDIKAGIEAEAQLEAERHAPETKAAIGAVDREIRKRVPEKKRNRRLAELDQSFEKGIYLPGTMGFSLQVDHALEILKLERERGTNEREALRLHPGAAVVLSKAKEYRRRDRGPGRWRGKWTFEA